ncbi:hypothetical protein HRH59_08450 [Rheinheimera sp. YQF-2]|uniref:Uncharacterized protein n=1 Tax=Rheinheimera lutimaris TaxID=2740584 RepID=A0A7Y5AQU0_9GAMM|nr:hypothetical protein [Rheinheimera lutimaris]NRQ42604.1 hypothetical protein [Rheinheimera lutimaris]
MKPTLTALTILATADGIKSAVALLTANGFTPIFKGSNFSDGWYELPELNFWIFRDRIYVNVHSNPASTLATVALKLHAQQQDSAIQVPASASPVVEHPVIQQPSTESVDNKFLSVISAALSKPEVLRSIRRTELRLKRSQAKGHTA